MQKEERKRPCECDLERASMMQREPSDLRGMWKSEFSSTAKMGAGFAR